MAVAARVDPKTIFTPEEWAPLARRSSWKGLFLLAHAWAVIFAAGAMVVIWPLTLPLAVIIIGGRQLGLAILMHDAAHGALHGNLKLNDLAGEWLTGGGLARYRTYHLGHHKFAQQAEDPDLVLSAPFPITPLSLRRKMIRDLTGQTAFKQRFGDLIARLKARKPGQPLLPILAEEVRRKRRWLLGGVIITAIGAPFGAWWAWPVLWVLPQFTWFPLITRLRNIAEHACVAKDEPDPLRHARTTHAGWLARMTLAPYFVNYHCEHHMFMHVPCYNLPRAHRLLQKKGVIDGMLYEPGGYGAVLKLATSKAG
ncbi:fatty acid desaturase family protein [Phenylobacterium sp.]|uniref:fatty acid desaturase family protein n=1 Tax=Phenylobacterium sp. TaxID=1871053 RepID=UPI0035B1F6D7